MQVVTYDSFEPFLQHDRLRLRIPLWIAALHLVLLSCMTITLSTSKPQKSAPKLVVHTVSLTPQPKFAPAREVVEKPQPIAQTAPAPAPAPVEAKPAPAVEAKPIPKPAAKPAPKPAPKPLPKPVKKAPPKPKAPPQPAKKPVQKSVKQDTAKVEAQAKAKAEAEVQAKANAKAKAKAEAAAAAERKREEERSARVAANLAEALASLDSAGTLDKKKSSLAKSAASSSGTSSPKAISTLASESLVQIEGQDASLSPQERTYYSELVSRLKLSLKLPEYGEVKVRLTLSRSGSVVSITGIKSKSKKNASYIEKTIPKLKLPPFGQNFAGEKEHTFKLTLSNELNY